MLYRCPHMATVDVKGLKYLGTSIQLQKYCGQGCPAPARRKATWGYPPTGQRPKDGVGVKDWHSLTEWDSNGWYFKPSSALACRCCSIAAGERLQRSNSASSRCGQPSTSLRKLHDAGSAVHTQQDAFVRHLAHRKIIATLWGDDGSGKTAK